MPTFFIHSQAGDSMAMNLPSSRCVLGGQSGGNVEVHGGGENYNPWQLKLCDLVIEKMGVVAL